MIAGRRRASLHRRRRCGPQRSAELDVSCHWLQIQPHPALGECSAIRRGTQVVSVLLPFRAAAGRDLPGEPARVGGGCCGQLWSPLGPVRRCTPLTAPPPYFEKADFVDVVSNHTATVGLRAERSGRLRERPSSSPRGAAADPPSGRCALHTAAATDVTRSEKSASHARLFTARYRRRRDPG